MSPSGTPLVPTTGGTTTSAVQPPLTFSVVIPTRNERDDIEATLRRCLELEGDLLEVIVVDDSSDETPAIVSSLTLPNVRLIHREKPEDGCCGARNAGLDEARGDVVIFLNADARPPRGFLSLLSRRYGSGADCVVVKSTVQNLSSVFGRYVAAQEARTADPDPDWSEGFSCRRQAALDVGGIPGRYPLSFCRDHLLGKALKLAGFKKLIDRSLEVEHVVPDTVASFWRNRTWRGSFAPLHSYFMRGMPISLVIARETAKLVRSLLRLALPVLPIGEAISLARFSPKHYRDLPGLIAVIVVAEVAFRVGNMRGLRDLLQWLPSRPSQAAPSATPAS